MVLGVGGVGDGNAPQDRGCSIQAKSSSLSHSQSSHLFLCDNTNGRRTKQTVLHWCAVNLRFGGSIVGPDQILDLISFCFRIPAPSVAPLPVLADHIMNPDINIPLQHHQ